MQVRDWWRPLGNSQQIIYRHSTETLAVIPAVFKPESSHMESMRWALMKLHSHRSLSNSYGVGLSSSYGFDFIAHVFEGLGI